MSGSIITLERRFGGHGGYNTEWSVSTTTPQVIAFINRWLISLPPESGIVNVRCHCPSVVVDTSVLIADTNDREFADFDILQGAEAIHVGMLVALIVAEKSEALSTMLASISRSVQRDGSNKRKLNP